MDEYIFFALLPENNPILLENYQEGDCGGGVREFLFSHDDGQGLASRLLSIS